MILICCSAYIDGFDAQQSESRRGSGWPNEFWRAALAAAADPTGPPVDIIPNLDPNAISTYAPLKILLLNGPQTNAYRYKTYYQSPFELYTILRLAGHDVTLWEDYDNLGAYLDGTYDAILLPDLYVYGDGSDLTPQQYQIRDFVANGGNLVLAGSYGDLFLYRVFGESLFSTLLYFPDYAEFIYPYGYNSEAHYTEGTLFSPYYDEGRVLPTFELTGIAQNSVDPGNFDYCPYYFPLFADSMTLCSVWSKSYQEGHISAISNSFSFSK